MQTIEIEDDVYGFLLQSTSRFGESPSEILRRLLKLSGATEQDSPETLSPGVSDGVGRVVYDRELSPLRNPRFRSLEKPF